MKTLLTGIAALGVAALVHAHPLVIEESSRIPPPPGVDVLRGDAALDGNEAVATSDYSYLDDDGENYITITSAWLYRRSGTTWTLVGKVGESDDSSIDDATNRNPIAMKNGVLALAFEPMYILEREGGIWVQKQVANHEPVNDVEIDGGRIFNGSGSWGGVIYEKDPVTGNWLGRAALYGDYSGVRTARKHIGWYVRALPGGEAFRTAMNAIEDCDAQWRAVAGFFPLAHWW